jgi:hypothetical protein
MHTLYNPAVEMFLMLERLLEKYEKDQDGNILLANKQIDTLATSVFTVLEPIK